MGVVTGNPTTAVPNGNARRVVTRLRRVVDWVRFTILHYRLVRSGAVNRRLPKIRPVGEAATPAAHPRYGSLPVGPGGGDLSYWRDIERRVSREADGVRTVSPGRVPEGAVSPPDAVDPAREGA